MSENIRESCATCKWCRSIKESIIKNEHACVMPLFNKIDFPEDNPPVYSVCLNDRCECFEQAGKE